MLHVQPSKESDVSRYRHGCDPPRATYPDLTPPVQILTLWPFLILIWLTVWLSAVPLSHIHIPDTTDRWSALHSGGAHTVFTPDLPGEVSCPLKQSREANSAHLSQRIVNSAELGIALLDEKSMANELNSLGTAYHFLEDSLLPSVVFALPEDQWKLRLSPACLASRAPPCLDWV